MANKSDARVDKLWSMLTDEFISRLKDGEEVAVKKDGEVSIVKVKASPATLSVITRFLKDNNVSGQPDDPRTNQVSDLLDRAKKDLQTELYEDTL